MDWNGFIEFPKERFCETAKDVLVGICGFKNLKIDSCRSRKIPKPPSLLFSISSEFKYLKITRSSKNLLPAVMWFTSSISLCAMVCRSTRSSTDSIPITSACNLSSFIARLASCDLSILIEIYQLLPPKDIFLPCCSVWIYTGHQCWSGVEVNTHLCCLQHIITIFLSLKYTFYKGPSGEACFSLSGWLNSVWMHSSCLVKYSLGSKPQFHWIDTPDSQHPHSRMHMGSNMKCTGTHSWSLTQQNSQIH